MNILAVTLYEAGTPTPRHRAISLQPNIAGKLSLHEQHDTELRRTVRTAMLRHPLSGENMLPPLRDAVVLWIGDGYMTITGFEQDLLSRRCTGQSWYLKLAL